MSLFDKLKQLQEDNVRLTKENKKLKESLDIATKCSCKEEDGIIRLSEENKNLKEKVNTYSEEYGELRKENKKLKRRIKTMQDFIDYEENLVKEVIALMYSDQYNLALKNLENYVSGDDSIYEEMEKAEDTEKEILDSVD